MKILRYRLNLLFTCSRILFLAAFPVIIAANANCQDVKDSAAEMDRVLSAAFPSGAPGAAVLVVQNGEQKLRKGYGLANLERHEAMDPSSALPICSITKQFTAVAILQLAEAGKLNLTDDITTWVPDFPTGGAKVSLAQILSHMSGIPSADEQPGWQKTWDQNLTPDQVLDLTRNKPLSFPPGSNFKYSNTGYFLLGKVIEKASGQSYPDYVRTHLLGPAAMANSYYPDDSHSPMTRTAGYSRSGKSWVPAAKFNMIQTYSAGALACSVDDMWAWEKALESGKLVGTPLLQSAYAEGHLPDGRGTHYGYGWEIQKLGRHDVIEHGGRMPGYTAYEAHVPDAGIYVVILCNCDDTAVPLRSVVTQLLRIALNEPAAPPTALEVANISDFTGNFRIAPGANFVVVADGDKLFGQLGPGRRPLKMVAQDEFTTPGDEWRLSFVRDDNHHIQKIVVQTDGPGPELVWPRVD